MGNWQRVMIEGTCAAAEVAGLRSRLAAGFADERWGCLHNGGICGLPNWAAETILAVGNLGERDYGIGGVAEELATLGEVVPSLSIAVHVGGDHESEDCAGTVTLAGGKVVIKEPQRDKIPELTENDLQARLLAQMARR